MTNTTSQKTSIWARLTGRGKKDKLRGGNKPGNNMTTTLNDGDMRDIVMALVQRSNINFSNVYLRPTDSELAERPETECWDGLIMRPEGYFRVAQEPQTGVKVILFEFEPKHLIGERLDDGSITLANLDQASKPDEPDVYRVAAFDPATDQAVLNDSISEFCRKLRNEIVPDLDLYLRDETPAADNGETDVESHTFRAANKDVAFGLYRDDEDNWQSVMYSTMRGNHDNSGRFERIAEKDRVTGRGKANEVFRLNKDELSEAEHVGGVLKHTLQYWGINSLKKFKGRQPLSENMTLKAVIKADSPSKKWDYSKVYLRQQYRKGWRFARGFWGKRYREYGLSAGVGIALSLKTLQFTAVRAAVIGVATSIGSIVFGKFIDEQTQKGVNTVFSSRAQYKEMRAQLPQARDYSRFFDAKTKENNIRALKKVDPALVGHIRLLDHAESGVMNSMDRTSALRRKNWRQQYLGGMETRMFGKANFPLCNNSVLKIMPNGVMSLTHMDEGGTLSKYYTYNEAFIASKAAPLHEAVKADLSEGVFKAVDEKTQAGIDGKKMRRCDFTKEIRKIYADVTDANGAPTEVPNVLSRLFNANAKGDPHDRVAELLSVSSVVAAEAAEDPLEVLMERVMQLRDDWADAKEAAEAAAAQAKADMPEGTEEGGNAPIAASQADEGAVSAASNAVTAPKPKPVR